MKPIIAVVVLVVLACRAQGADYYVSNQGDDGSPGTSLAAPWRTIARANGSVAPGDTVHIRGGTYAESLAPVVSGVEGKPITFRAYAGEPVTLTEVPLAVSIKDLGYVVVDGISCRAVNQFMSIDGSHHVQVLNGTFAESSQKEGWVNGVVLRNESHHNRIANCRIERVGYATSRDDIGGTMYIGGGSHRNVVENCTLAYGGHHVLQIVSDHNIIRNNYLHNENWMVAPHRTATGGMAGNRNLIIEGGGGWNVLEGNVLAFSGVPPDQEGSSGMSVRTPHNIIRRNVFHDNDMSGLNVYSSSQRAIVRSNRIYHNVFYRNAHAAMVTFEPFLSGLSLTRHGQAAIEGVFVLNNVFWQNRNGAALSFYHCNRADQSIQGNWEEAGDPLFVNDKAPADPLRPGVLDFRLQPQSPCVDAGEFLTRTASAGRGLLIPVEDAGFFTDGYGVAQGDVIQMEGKARPLRVLGVDYEANVIRVDYPVSWEAGQGVSQPFSGARPDIGAFER